MGSSPSNGSPAFGSGFSINGALLCFLLLVDGPIWSALQIFFTFLSIGDVRCVSLSWNWWSHWTALAKNVDLQVHSCLYLDCMLLVRGNEFHHIYIYIYIDLNDCNKTTMTTRNIIIHWDGRLLISCIQWIIFFDVIIVIKSYLILQVYWVNSCLWLLNLV